MNKGVYLPDNFTDVLDFYFEQHGGDQSNMFVGEDEQEEQNLHKEAQDTLNKQRKDSEIIMDKLNKAMNVSRQDSFSTKKILNDSFYNSNRMLKMLKSGNKVDNTTFNQHAIDYLLEAIEYIKEKPKDTLLDEIFTTNSQIMETKIFDSLSSNTSMDQNGTGIGVSPLKTNRKTTFMRTDSNKDKDNGDVDHGSLLKTKLDNLHMKLRQAEKPSRNRRKSFKMTARRTLRKSSTMGCASAYHSKFEHNLADVSHTKLNLSSIGNLADISEIAMGSLHNEQLKNHNKSQLSSSIRQDSGNENHNFNNTTFKVHDDNDVHKKSNSDYKKNNKHGNSNSNGHDTTTNKVEGGGKTYHYHHIHNHTDKKQLEDGQEQVDEVYVPHLPIHAALQSPKTKTKTTNNFSKLNIVGEEEDPDKYTGLSNNTVSFNTAAFTTSNETEADEPTSDPATVENGSATIETTNINMEPHEPPAPRRSMIGGRLSMVGGHKVSHMMGLLDINAIATGTKMYGGGVKEVLKVYGSGQSLETQVEEVCKLEIHEIPSLQKVVATTTGEWKGRNEELRSALQAVRDMSSASQDGSTKLVGASENFQHELQSKNRIFARKLHLKTVEKHHIKTLLTNFPNLQSLQGSSRIGTVFSRTQAKATKAQVAKTFRNISNCDWFVRFVFNITNGIHQRLHPITLEIARTLWLFQYLISQGIDFSKEQEESRQYLISRILEAGKDCDDEFHHDPLVIGGKSTRVDTDMVKLYELLHNEFGIENEIEVENHQMRNDK